MTPLIKRLKEATKGSRELDISILEFLQPGASRVSNPPRYTTSLDAARALVPDGWNWMCENNGARDWAVGTVTYYVAPPLRTYRAEAATPALALSIAALKASKHYAIVPRKPTQEMLIAGWDARNRQPSEVWEEMLYAWEKEKELKP